MKNQKTGALKAVQPEPKTVQEWIRLRRIELRKAGKAKKMPIPARLFLVKRSKPAQQMEFTFERPEAVAVKPKGGLNRHRVDIDGFDGGETLTKQGFRSDRK
jgi:hypothetical protein